MNEDNVSPLSPEETRKPTKIPRKNSLDPFTFEPSEANNPFADHEDDNTAFESDGCNHQQGEIPRVAEKITQRQEEDWALQTSRTAARVATVKHARKFSVQKLTREKSGRRQQKPLNRSVRPGLAVLTNVSRHHGPTPAMQPIDDGLPREDSETLPKNLRAHTTGAVPSSQKNVRQATGFVGLADLKSLDEHSAPNKGFWWSREKGQRKDEKTRMETVLGNGRTEGSNRPAPDNSAERKGNIGFQSKTMRSNNHGYKKMDDQEEDVPSLVTPATGLGINPTVHLRESEDGSRENSEVGRSAGRRLVPPPIKLEDDLSPSDRPIVIGLSIPSAKLGDHNLSPQSASSDMVNRKSSFTSRKRGLSETSLVTPTIVITPAREEVGASPFRNSFGRPRAASSVYSQPTPFVGGYKRGGDVPPMPVLPANIYGGFKSTYPFAPPKRTSKDSTSTLFEEDQDEKHQSRGMSTYTDFEDDDMPLNKPREPSSSADSGRKLRIRTSIDTIANRYQSRGWWNYITTPFLTRPNSMLTRRDTVSASRPPDVPGIAEATALAKKHGEQGEKNLQVEFSPITPHSQELQTRPDQTWADMSEWEEERKNTNGTYDRRSTTTEGTPDKGIKEERPANEYPNSNNPFFRMQHTDLISADRRSQDLTRQSQYSIFSPNDRDVPMLFDDAHHEPDIQEAQKPFFQAPSDPFASAFRQVMPETSRSRAQSGSTDIEDDFMVSPTVHHAYVAPVVRAGASLVAATLAIPSEPEESTEKAEAQAKTHSLEPPPYSAGGRNPYPRYVAILPPGQRSNNFQPPPSPGPISPGMQHAMSSRGGIQMAEVPVPLATAAAQRVYNVNHYYSEDRNLPPRTHPVPLALTHVEAPSDLAQRAEARRQRMEKEDVMADKVARVWRGRGCFSSKGCAGRGGAEGRKRRRWYCGLTVVLLAMIILVIVLAMTLHRKGDNTPVQSQWLNGTGFPPIPTGISTIAQPDAVMENSGCVHPASMWSCALSKELQETVAPNDPDQPNFRIEIRFRNDSDTNSSFTNSTSNKKTRGLAHKPVSVRSLLRSRWVRVRDSFTDTLWTPSPSPPSIEDQIFLSNTTDNVTSSLKQGEQTPFYITFLPIISALPSSSLKRRQGQNNTDPFPNITSDIPPPSINSNGTAAPANLLPYPTSQPLRLYDRGLSTEHYGFYNYFDRSIFLKSSVPINESDTPDSSDDPDDENGGATEDEAAVRCTWAQTRFLVQIWTNQASTSILLPSDNATATPTETISSSKPLNTTASANDFSRPGSFPYPVTVTLDRHGGNISQKMVYCYGLDDAERIVYNEKKLQLEYRAFGGTLVNPALGPFGNVNVSTEQGGPGGIDGGTGGCQCQWRNWAPSG
ncbi:MAG: hypothetical protein M1827_007077 [Pycnora praestabilis]|nr:MAG: hypothetical protein M1827_007077 [Pycnora praestabilis]